MSELALIEPDLDLLAKLVDEAARRGAEYADARLYDEQFTRIIGREGVFEARSGRERGISIRVYYQGAWGFAYVTRFTWEELLRGVERAVSMARAAAGTAAWPKPVELKAMEGVYTWPVRRDPVSISSEEKLADLQELDKLIAANSLVKSRTVSYAESILRRAVATSDGRTVEEYITRVRVAAEAYGAEGDRRGSAYVTEGTIEGYTVWEKAGGQEALAGKLLKRLEGQVRGVPPRPGEYPVVLAPEAVGVLVHEAFGHLAEADHVVAGDALTGKLGRYVASEHVTIVDSPSEPDGFGNTMYDDEAVRGAKVVIVERGVLKGYLTDRSLCQQLGMDPTGNARAESFRVRPIIRMRNTYIAPGDYKPEELFEGVREGYYIVSIRGGETNLDGSFQVGVEEAYVIRRGEVAEPVRNMAISGNTLETLRLVDAVANDLKLHAGYCGKLGQLVPVGDGGPHIRVKRMAVGGYE